jgi:polysaccharide deacetylase 2 family uncharacterized protein YibQ
MAKKKKRDAKRLQLLALLLVVLIVAVISLIKYFDTPGGRIILLDIGFKSRFAAVQEELGESILGALEQSGIGRGDITFDSDEGMALPAVTLDVQVGEKESLLKINAALDAAVRASGGRVRSCIEGKRGRSITLEVGTRRTVTHRCYIWKDRRKPRAVTPAGPAPAVALIVDDFGFFNNKLVREFLALEIPLTISVIPGLKHSSDICAQAGEAGKEILCHLPMEPESGAEDVGEIPVVRVSMKDRDIRNAVEKALATTPGVVGMNNHMGSRATADRRVMGAVLEVCKKKDLIFIDSMTTNRSVVAEVAADMGIRSMENSLFIDNSSDETRDNMRKVMSIASRRGDIVAILHIKRDTLGHLRWMIEEARREGIRFVTVTEMIEIKDRKATEGGRS